MSDQTSVPSRGILVCLNSVHWTNGKRGLWRPHKDVLVISRGVFLPKGKNQCGNLAEITVPVHCRVTCDAPEQGYSGNSTLVKSRGQVYSSVVESLPGVHLSDRACLVRSSVVESLPGVQLGNRVLAWCVTRSGFSSHTVKNACIIRLYKSEMQWCSLKTLCRELE